MRISDWSSTCALPIWPRPAIVPHLDHVSSWSYPSGHAASVAAVAIALTLLFPPRWRRGAAAGAALAILLTDLSRVTLGVHWASDVVGGTLLGDRKSTRLNSSH